MSMPSFEESSRTRRTGRRRKIVFDLPGAEKTLPFVRRVLAEIVEKHAELSHLRLRSRRSPSAKYGSWGRRCSVFRMHDRIKSLDRELEQVKEELQALGVKLIDVAHGSIGFPTIVNGSLAYLVFQHEDDGIWYWRYRDQPKLRSIPECWYEQDPFAEEQTEGMLV